MDVQGTILCLVQGHPPQQRDREDYEENVRDDVGDGHGQQIGSSFLAARWVGMVYVPESDLVC